MNTLSLKQIQFIDAYLKNVGVLYEDIRFEMTDHVATAIEQMEGDFLENLKNYMVLYKDELLTNNKKYGRTAARRAWMLLGKNLVRPGFVLLFAGLFIGIILLKNRIGLSAAFGIMQAVYGGIVLVVFFHYLYNRAISKMRFSVTDKLLTSVCIVLYCLMHVFKPQKHIENQVALSFYYAFITTFLIAVYYGYIVLVKKYKRQFIK